MSEEIVFREQYGVSGKEKFYAKPLGGDSVLELEKDVKPHQAFGETIANFFREAFLPQGYPDSVSKDYFAYQLWDTVQAFCSTIMGTLTTHSIMKGVGVGDAAATPLAAAVTWIMKDGTGMVSRIFFAWWKGTYLDADCKKWRLVADGVNDVAMCLEMCLPLLMQYSTPLLCVSTAMKAVVGVAGGATRAAITQHQAIRNNMGDVSAKDGSQETFVNLCASLAGIAILSTVEDGMHAWLLFIFFAVSHITANYMAVRALQMTNLNEERLLLLLKTYLLTEIAATPRSVQFSEAVILGTGLSAHSLCGHKIIMGASLKQALKGNNLTATDIKFITNQYQAREYIHVENTRNRVIYIILHKDITTIRVLQAYFHAVLYGIAATMLYEENLPLLEMKKELYERSAIMLGVRSALTHAHFLQCPPDIHISAKAMIAVDQVIDQNFATFIAQIETHGWQTDIHLLPMDEWRGNWQK